MTMPQDEDANTAGHGEPGGPERDDLCSELEAFIVARPFRALGMALLAGIVVGKLIL